MSDKQVENGGKKKNGYTETVCNVDVLSNVRFICFTLAC